jgi:SulP family sulfate permease
MSEWHAFVNLFRSPKSDIAILLVTFFLTILIDLTVAIQVGVLLAAFLFLQRMSNETQINLITENLRERDEEEARDISKLTVPPGVEIFEIYGSLFFGAIERFKDAMKRIEKRPRILIIRMRHVVAIDATGLLTMEELLTTSKRHGTTLILSAVASQPLAAMQQSGFLERLGKENIAENIYEALDRAKAILHTPGTEQPLPLESNA